MTNNESDKCPCEECISFAICYNSIEIRCKLLYVYLCVMVYHPNCIDGRRFLRYIRGRGDVVYKLYKKYIHRTDIGTYGTFLTENKDVRDIRCYE